MLLAVKLLTRLRHDFCFVFITCTVIFHILQIKNILTKIVNANIAHNSTSTSSLNKPTPSASSPTISSHKVNQFSDKHHSNHTTQSTSNSVTTSSSTFKMFKPLQVSQLSTDNIKGIDLNTCSEVSQRN